MDQQKMNFKIYNLEDQYMHVKILPKGKNLQRKT